MCADVGLNQQFWFASQAVLALVCPGALLSLIHVTLPCPDHIDAAVSAWAPALLFQASPLLSIFLRSISRAGLLPCSLRPQLYICPFDLASSFPCVLFASLVPRSIVPACQGRRALLRELH